MCRKIQGSYYIPRRVGTEGTFFDCFILWEKKKSGYRGGECESENGVTNSRQIGPVQSVASAFFFT
jgi:hypothetical protein